MNNLNPSYVLHLRERKEVQYDLITKLLYEDDKIQHGVALIQRKLIVGQS